MGRTDALQHRDWNRSPWLIPSKTLQKDLTGAHQWNTFQKRSENEQPSWESREDKTHWL